MRKIKLNPPTKNHKENYKKSYTFFVSFGYDYKFKTKRKAKDFYTSVQSSFDKTLNAFNTSYSNLFVHYRDLYTLIDFDMCNVQSEISNLLQVIDFNFNKAFCDYITRDRNAFLYNNTLRIYNSLIEFSSLLVNVSDLKKQHVVRQRIQSEIQIINFHFNNLKTLLDGDIHS